MDSEVISNIDKGYKFFVNWLNSLLEAGQCLVFTNSVGILFLFENFLGIPETSKNLFWHGR